MISRKILVFACFLFIVPFIGVSAEQPQLEYKYIEVKKGDTYESLFGENWEIVARINKIDRYHLLPGIRLKVPLDWEKAKDYPFFPKELPYEKEVPKLILIVIEEQFGASYEFGKLQFSFPVSSGIEKGLSPKEIIEKGGLYPTPRGRFKVLYKRQNHKSSVFPGPTGGQLMPFTIMFTWRGHAFHAWGDPGFPDLSGKMPGYPNSHGCLELFIEDAEKLFNWAERDTDVLIVDNFECLRQLIVVEIEQRTLKFFEDGELIFEFSVGVGKKTVPTPVGRGIVYEKRKQPVFRYTIGPDAGKIIRYSKLKDGRVIKVPYEKMRALGIFINGTDKNAIHSTTEEDSIGQAISKGCIRMRIDDMLIFFPRVLKCCRINIKP